MFDKIKFYSGVLIIAIAGLVLSSAIGFGIYSPRQYSEFAVIGSLGAVVLALLGSIIVQSIPLCDTEE